MALCSTLYSMMMSLCNWEPRTEPNTPDVTSPVLSRDEGSPHSTCWQCSAYIAQGLFYFFAIRMHYHLLFYLLPTRTPRAFSAELPSSWSALSCNGASHVQEFSFPLAEFHKISVHPFLQPIKVLLNSSTTS